MFHTALFGYNRREVDRFIRDINRYVDTLKSDVEYLKREQSQMREQIEKLILSDRIYGNLDNAADVVREYQ